MTTDRREGTMRFDYSYPTVIGLDDRFRCRSRRRDLTLDKCLDDFLEANAFEKRRSACHRCTQGRKNRESFSGCSGEDDSGIVRIPEPAA
jgi:hypothetical protein